MRYGLWFFQWVAALAVALVFIALLRGDDDENE